MQRRLRLQHRPRQHDRAARRCAPTAAVLITPHPSRDRAASDSVASSDTSCSLAGTLVTTYGEIDGNLGHDATGPFKERVKVVRWRLPEA